MLVLVVAAAIIALAVVATVLAIAINAVVGFVRRLVTGVVAAFVAAMAVVTAVAVTIMTIMTIVTIVSIVRAGATTVSASRLGTAFARFLGARFLGGLLGFLLLELIEYAVRSIGILALLEEADERDVVVGQGFMRLRILLLMLPWHRKEDLLDLLRLHGQLHRCTKEPFLEVAHELHSSSHVVMHRHECGLSSRTKPADQLVTDVWEPGERLEIVSLAVDEVLIRLARVVRASRGHDVQPFGQADLLEALFQEREQRGPVALLVRRQSRNDLRLEVRKSLREEELGAEASLVGQDASSKLFPVHGERDLDAVRLFQAVCDRLIWKPIRAQRGPLVVPRELWCQEGFEEVGHGG